MRAAPSAAKLVLLWLGNPVALAAPLGHLIVTVEIWRLVVIYATWILREVLRSALAGQPFPPANSRRLQRIGYLILASTVVFPIPEYLIGKAILADFHAAGLTLSPALRLSTDWILGGLLFLVLGAIFSHGTELERERALTV